MLRAVKHMRKKQNKQYLKLNDKYPMDAYALIAKEDFVQASEKLRGAAAEIVKAIAARRGIVIKSHAELYTFVSKNGYGT